jgi:hypothetical protein
LFTIYILEIAALLDVEVERMLSRLALQFTLYRGTTGTAYRGCRVIKPLKQAGRTPD